MKTDLFPSCSHCWVFQICWHIEWSSFTALSFRIWNSLTGIPSPPLALFIVMLPKDHLTSCSRMSGSRWVIRPWKKQESSRKTSISVLLTMPKPLTVWITINWKILKEMRIPDHLTYLLRNLYAGQEATVRTGHGATDWFQIGKGVCQGCILSPCLFNFYAEYIMRNAGLEEAQAGIKIAGRNINNLRYANDTSLMAESEE